MLVYGSVCSGIEAATVAWHPLGWRPAFFSEIEKFPAALLSHYYPTVPNHGDLNGFLSWPQEKIDVLVGGTPCQSFSVAGLRKGLADPRGNLCLTFLALADRLKPRWLVWENVPGVLSSGGGRDFGSFLGALGQLGYGFAYRVLDAQYFGVPQRRRRVFVVGCLGDWRRAAAVLFERESLRGDSPPRREARKGIAARVADCLTKCHAGPPDEARGTANLILMDQPFEVANCLTRRMHKGINTTIDEGQVAVATSVCLGSDPIHNRECAMPQTRRNGDPGVVQYGMQVRRLTPRECERLQGFPDDYTLIPYRNKPAADGPRYKALGNSMAVPVMRWIGERIAEQDALT